MTVTDTGAHSRGFKGAHTHTRGTTVHQRSLRRRDGVARFIKAQQQAAVRPVDSLGTPRSHSRLKTPPILRPQAKDVALGDGRPKGHSGACEPVHADSPGNARRWGYQVTIPTNNIIIINNIKATTDSAAGSHLPSFIQLYWAPQQTRHGWWDGEE